MKIQSFAAKAAAVAVAHRQLARQILSPPVRFPDTRRRRRLPLVLYSQVAWDTVWQRPQEEALGLSNHRPVIFISPVQIHELALRLRDRWQLVRTLNGGRLIVLSPVILSGEYRSAAVRRINRQIILDALRKQLGGRQFILFTNTPFCAWLLDHFEPRIVVYDLIDDFCSFEWAPDDGRESERRLVSQCDLAFAGTGYLREMYEPFFPGLEFLPSGVRFDDLTAPAPVPADIEALPSPRALYVGTLNDRLDGSLFKSVAEALPGGSVVVVGPKHGTFSAPEMPANVHFLGLKPHTELAGYYQHCDLGIMPFADSPAARAINPVKTLEFLACGLPVLSTPVPDVEKYYKGVVRVEPPSRWPAAVTELLAGDSGELRSRRRDFARDRSWSSLTRRIEEQLRIMEKITNAH